MAHTICLLEQQDAVFNFLNILQEVKSTENKPIIDSKPTIRVRNPPGGKSSIFF